MPEKKQSTISRLESKYSEVLGRRRRKEQQEASDRDKTIEPEKPSYLNPLSRSATTILTSSSGSTPKKERTPYRLHRNYSDRNPTHVAGSYKSRPELSLLHNNASNAVPKSSYYESPILRHKDTVYDAYNYNRVPTSRHNDYDPLGYGSGTSGGAYGYYEGRDKENTFKSKYEPSRLYAELNNTDSFVNRDRDRAKRFQKNYRRTATTGDRRTGTSYFDYDDDLLSTPSTSSAYSSTMTPSVSRYEPRKSYQRSQTQKFFDSENASVLRTLNDANNNNIDYYGDEIKTQAMKEREARRKEIQGLIAKYAQIDDVYNRAIDNEPVNRSSINNNSASVLDSKPTDLLSSSSALGLGLSQAHATTASLLPLSKTQSVSSMSSISRSRIPKTYSTFVRIILSYI